MIFIFTSSHKLSYTKQHQSPAGVVFPHYEPTAADHTANSALPRLGKSSQREYFNYDNIYQESECYIMSIELQKGIVKTTRG